MRQFRKGTIAMLLSVAAGVACAQTVYESRDKAGPVFSDKPSAGSTPVTPSPPNVVSMPVPQVPAPAVAPAVAPPPYKSLVFVSIGEGGTIHTNTGAFEFTVRAVPALRSTDRYRIQLDGRELPGRYRGTNLRVSEADWRSAARDQDVQHALQVGIVDADGNVLIVSDAISFFAHRATVGGGRR